MISKILKNRLDEHNIEIKEIIENISLENERNISIFAYTSQMDGIGNRMSDLDVYVIAETIPTDEKRFSRYNDCKSRIDKINGLVIDVEYWKMETICKMIESRSYIRDVSKMKVLCRLLKGDIILGENIGTQLKEKIKILEINKTVAEYFQGMASQEYDDASKMFGGGNYFSAINCARKSLDYIIAAYSAKEGISILNLKWIPQILLNNEGFGDKNILKIYYNMHYDKIKIENIKDKAEELLRIVSDVMFDISCV